MTLAQHCIEQTGIKRSITQDTKLSDLFASLSYKLLMRELSLESIVSDGKMQRAADDASFLVHYFPPIADRDQNQS